MRSCDQNHACSDAMVTPLQRSTWRGGMLVAVSDAAQSPRSASSKSLHSQEGSQGALHALQHPARAPRMQRSAPPGATPAAPYEVHELEQQQQQQVPRRMSQLAQDQPPRFDGSGLVLPLWGSSGGRAAWQESQQGARGASELPMTSQQGSGRFDFFGHRVD